MNEDSARRDAERYRDASPIMRYFEYRHLPPKLARYSKPFCALAKQIDVTMKNSAEKSVCLRKLLEAKDACVRASLDEPDQLDPLTQAWVDEQTSKPL